jgi:hypothetical protein
MPVARTLKTAIVCILVAGLWPAPQAGAQGTAHLRMQKVVKDFVAATGYEVIGLGSWIAGKTYNPTTSDHDLRLLMPPGSTTAQQQAAWREARERLAALVRKEFGDQADNVLGRTNLYAPSGLMAGVEDLEDARAVYARAGQVPNLGYKGPVTASTPAKYAEGLYGDGAQAFTQFYEQNQGRLFYKSGNVVVMGGTDLTHFSEGAARFTSGGTASTATQWIEHAAEEMAAGRGDKVAKYLERIERDLTKSRQLAGLPVDEAFRSELRAMKDALKAGGHLGSVTDDLTRLLSRGKMEAALLRNMDEAGPVSRGVLRVMLDGVALKSQAGRLLEQAYAKVSGVMTADQFMNGLMVYMAASATAEAAGEGGARKALMVGLPQFAQIASLPVGLLLELTSSILSEAEAAGYTMAANSQNAWDLMAGIYSAWGRCDTDPDPRHTMTLQDLLRVFKYEFKLQAYVYGRAVRASTRDLGEATGESDQEVAEEIFSQCWPVIRDAWRWERDRLASEFLVKASEIVHSGMLVAATPNPAGLPEGGKAVVKARAVFRGVKFAANTERMAEIMRLLYGKGSGVYVGFTWTPSHAIQDRDWEHVYTFTKPGVYPVAVKLEISPYTKHTQPEPRVMLKRTLASFVDVEVGVQKEAVCKGCGKKPGTTPGCLYCTLYNHEPGSQTIDPSMIPQPVPAH